uniref:L-ascorbate metabolism protein UlaG, beta-lactamase superfamily n=1 Tax=Candidatus Kentrum sp. DK TaxID=2126562 RepID=A0A450TAY9_9GAMM|nr:MAG: L-ascorbate metabolism protein UlaG, beta-lactamase superfamily [Candidatus Kentron sp. DK]
MITAILIAIVGVFILGLYLYFGKARPAGDSDAISASPNFDPERGKFVNKRQDEIDEFLKNQSMLGMLIDFFRENDGPRKPPRKLPEVKPVFADFLAKDGWARFLWFGHSTILVNLGGKLILTDPLFAKGMSVLNPRFQDMVVPLEALPDIDYILLTHDHYDHLHKDTLRFFKDKDTVFLTPLGVGAYLTEWGIGKDRIHEFDWWGTIRRDGITFTCTPSLHFSGRGLPYGNGTLWGSWAIRNATANIYFSGDTGYGEHFQEIGDRLGPFDMAFLDVGQYHEKWKYAHMFPRQAPKALRELRGKHLVPIHWGGFSLANHSWYEPIEEVYKYSQQENTELVAPKIGQIVEIGGEYNLETWWRSLMEPEA